MEIKNLLRNQVHCDIHAGLKALLVTLLAGTGFSPSKAQVNVFDTYKSGNSTYYYRIPAIAKDADGHLLAFADYRNTSNSDIGSNHGISVYVKTSDDDGKTWGSQVLVAMGDGNKSGFTDSHGDPAVVIDRETDKIMMCCASGTVGFLNSTKSNPIRMGRYYSEDGGQTWTETDITSDVYGVFSSQTAVTGLFFSSGRICQSSRIKVGSHYRIYSAVDGPANVGCLVVYSDDFGQTWNALGGPSARPTVSPYGDESKIEELPDGNVLLYCRSKQNNTNGRLFNIYTYTDQQTGAGSWGTMAISNNSTSGTYSYNNACNGEILIVPVTRLSDNKEMYLALASCCYGSGRANVSIYYKPLSEATDYDAPSDFSTGWTRYPVSTTYSCYSTMTLDKNGDVAFLYEDMNDNGVSTTYDILFKTFPVTTLTANTYQYRGESPEEPEEDVWGDVNGDGKVTIADVTTLVDYILGKLER